MVGDCVGASVCTDFLHSAMLGPVVSQVSCVALPRLDLLRVGAEARRVLQISCNWADRARTGGLLHCCRCSQVLSIAALVIFDGPNPDFRCRFGVGSLRIYPPSLKLPPRLGLLPVAVLRLCGGSPSESAQERQKCQTAQVALFLVLFPKKAPGAV